MSSDTVFLILIALAMVLSPFVARTHTRTRMRRQSRQRPARSKSPARRAAAPAPPSRRPAKVNTAQTRAILQRRLGAQWEAEQQRIRERVLEQERKIAARLRQAQRTLDFEELTALHTKSRQTADLAFATMDSARSTEQVIADGIRDTHRAIDADRARGGRQIPNLRQVLDGLHLDRTAIRDHRERYLQDVHRLNRATAQLRDSINANCGEKGRKWYQALMARTKARQEQRR
jgi:hypothetical protein